MAPRRRGCSIRNASGGLNVAGDHPSVDVWVLDSNGNPIASPGYRLWSPPASSLPDLQPGESIVLDDIEFITDPSIELFAAGTYQVVGVLHDLGLRSEPGALYLKRTRATGMAGVETESDSRKYDG
mgnify:CR=1 FL=1